MDLFIQTVGIIIALLSFGVLAALFGRFVENLWHKAKGEDGKGTVDRGIVFALWVSLLLPMLFSFVFTYTLHQQQGEQISAVKSELSNAIKAVDNKIGAVQNEIKAVDNKIGAVQNEIKAVNNKIDAVLNRIGVTENKIVTTENKIGALDNKIGATDNKIEALRNDMDR